MALKDYSDSEAVRSRGQDLVSTVSTADFWSGLRGKCSEEGLGRCLTAEMERRFGLGGFLFVESV